MLGGDDAAMNAKPGSIAASRVEMTEIILPQFANAIGTAFGGQILAWMDTAAAVVAMRHCEGIAVTASIDEVHFQEPIHQGDVVTLLSWINYTGRSSMEIEVQVFTENVRQPRQLAVRAYLTFVHVDEHGRPTPVRQAVLETDEERIRWEKAKRRVEARKARAT